MSLCKLFSSGLVMTAAIAVLGFSAVAKAGVIPITVTNGGFETLTAAGTSNQLGFKTGLNSTIIQNATGWTNNSTGGTLGYNFIFSGSTVNGDTYGSAYSSSGGPLSLWAMENGVSNNITSSPLGGNFLAMDGAYEQASVSQVLTGLTVGMDTQVSFYYAGAQQSGYTGTTTEGFQVSLAGTLTESHSTAILTDDSHGFTGWHYTELDFVPTSATETLSFLALGTPAGEPPFSLLDGISVVQVTPEPSSLALLGTGVVSLCLLGRRRFSPR